MSKQEKQGILLESGTNELEIIEVFIDEEDGYRGYYGINVAKVLEIINMPGNVTIPPNAAGFVHGVFNHRDKVIMLLDLAKWLGRRQSENGQRIAIITEFNEITTAFLVTGVTRIHRTSWANIKPLDGYIQNYCSAITGTILLEGKTVLMLDLERAVGQLDPRLSVPYSDSETKEEAYPDVNTAAMEFPLKILHADDSKMIRQSVKRLLETDQEFVVASMVDGREAWDYLIEIKQEAKDQQKSITDFVRLILSDIEMPEMDGYHLCQKVKNDPVLRDLPVVLFSSLINEKIRHKGDSVGADAQYTKPSPAGLVHDLKNLILQRSKS